jgi:hypothetical protein
VSHAALIGNPADETLDYKKDITRPCCASRGQGVILVEHLMVFGAGRFALRGHFKDYFGASIAASSGGAASIAVRQWFSQMELLVGGAKLVDGPGQKTRALEITELLVPSPVLAVNVSPACLIRRIGAEEGVTVLFDEVDTVFGPRTKENNEDVRALLNAGYRRGVVVGRCVMHGSIAIPEELPAFAPVALAGLGTLPDTVLSRSIVVRMQRRSPDEHVTPYRRRDHAEEGQQICNRSPAGRQQPLAVSPYRICRTK